MLERFEDADGFVGYRSPLLASHAIPHLFTTRIGGRGRALDLGRLDERGVKRVALAAGLPDGRIAVVTQVHGANVLELRSDGLPGEDARADGLVSERDDVLVGVHVADCVPVLLARSDGRRVGAVHAGWRGLVAGVIPRAVERLGAGRLLAAIGPCLSLARFEVGPEVVRAFAEAGLGDSIHESENARACIDLRVAAAMQLESAGVAVVETNDRCTYEDAEEFYSYRRDVTHGGQRRTGRLGAFIAPPRKV
jgi:YfiH family protein